jgi:hypothetical protein
LNHPTVYHHFGSLSTQLSLEEPQRSLYTGTNYFLLPKKQRNSWEILLKLLKWAICIFAVVGQQP